MKVNVSASQEGNMPRESFSASADPQHRRQRNRNWLKAGGLVATAAVTSLALTTSPASAARIQSGAPIMSAPTPYSIHQGGPIGNQYFTMRCYVDSAWARGTNRWFYGNALAYNHRTGRFNLMYGYVNASYVYNQDRVGRC